MKVPLPRLDALFDATLQDLEQHGVVPTPRESVWLHHLCERCVRPDAHDVNPWLPPAVTLGSLRLWPLTVQARIWLEEHAAKFFQAGGDMDALSVAYAMAFGKNPGAFDELTDRKSASSKIQWWAARLPLTIAQVREALTRWISGGGSVEIDSPNMGTPAPLDWGTALSALCWHYKLSPSEVIVMSEAQAADMLRNIPDRDRPDISSDDTRALEQLRLAKIQVLKSHEVPT